MRLFYMATSVTVHISLSHLLMCNVENLGMRLGIRLARWNLLATSGHVHYIDDHYQFSAESLQRLEK